MRIHIPIILLPPVLVSAASAMVLNATEILEARDGTASTVSIILYTKTNCQDFVGTFNPVTYGVNNAVLNGQPLEFASYHLNRNLQKGEQLDFSRPADGVDPKSQDPDCSHYFTSSYEGQVDATKCQTPSGNAATCFRLLQH